MNIWSAAINVEWADRKLARASRTESSGRRRFGDSRWRALKLRLAALKGAPTLADLQGVGGFHPLRADRAGSFALNLDGPYRLVFRPDHDPVPAGAGGGIDTSAVTRVIIEGIVDYHGA